MPRMRLVYWGFLLTAALSMSCSSGDDSSSGDGSGGSGGGAGSGPRTGEFVALTYNVAGLPEGLSSSNPSVNMPFISPLLNDYDLVLTQEDWLTPDPNPFEGSMEVYHDLLMADAEHPYQSTPAPLPLGQDPTRPEALVSDGLNEFSNFEFRDLVRVRWAGCFGGLDNSDGGAADCIATKGFFVATHVLAPGVEVDVFDLHGEAGSTTDDQRLSEEDYQQLAEYINQNSTGRAILLGGDTNLHTEPGNPDATIWQNFLAASGLSDVCSVVACGDDEHIIDKFAFRSNDSVTLEPLSHHFEREKFVHPTSGEPLSDHLALAVRWRWERN
jgi:hypothetical protein